MVLGFLQKREASCKREKGEEGKMRIGMGSQRGGWVLGEGERVGGVGKLTNVGDKCVCVGGGGGLGGQVWGDKCGCVW